MGQDADQPFSIKKYSLQNTARQLDAAPLRVRTSVECWSYALALPKIDVTVTQRLGSAQTPCIVEVELTVTSGRVGVGCVALDGSRFLQEHYVDSDQGNALVRCFVDDLATCSALIFRNAFGGGVSEFAVTSIACYEPETNGILRFGEIPHRDFTLEGRPEQGGIEIFETKLANDINRARLDHLRRMQLPLKGMRVLDVGCGVGIFANFYRGEGCQVVAVDGRAENIARMAECFPGIEGYVADVQSDSLTRYGKFDVVHCYGLLYHLESPIKMLRNIAEVCEGFVIVETIVVDTKHPLMVIVDEANSANQALHGLGCRPSPTFVGLALNRVGFQHVYMPSHAPRHEDFAFQTVNDMEWRRDGHNLRAVFIGSRKALESPNLIRIVA